jgi:hypothetical protein
MSEPLPSQQLVQMTMGSWIARTIYVAAKLRIADHLANGPRAANELATAAGVAPGPLYRVLRALASVGVFAQEANGRFRINPLAAPLREAGPDSLWAVSKRSQAAPTPTSSATSSTTGTTRRPA